MKAMAPTPPCKRHSNGFIDTGMSVDQAVAIDERRSRMKSSHASETPRLMDGVEIASIDSFPCSDPPSSSACHA